MQWKYISVLFIISLQAGVWATDLPDLSQINVNDFQSHLPAEWANNNLTLDDAKNLMREKCINVAGDKDAGLKAYEQIEAGTAVLMECFAGIVNYTALQKEIDDAKPHGELDTVFHKYCARRPQALDCVEAFNAKLVPCLDAEEQESKDVFMRIVRSLLNFICHKGGDQIALFIAEEGPACLSSKLNNTIECLNETLRGYLPKDGGIEQLKNQKLPKFVLGDKQCNEMQRIETCIVAHLEQCKEITPANIVDSMFRFIRNETICRNTPMILPAKHSIKSGSQHLAGSNMWLSCSLLLTLGLLQLLVNKHYVA